MWKVINWLLILCLFNKVINILLLIIFGLRMVVLVVVVVMVKCVWNKLVSNYIFRFSCIIGFIDSDVCFCTLC